MLSSIVKTILKIISHLGFVEFMILIVEAMVCLFNLLGFFKHIVRTEVVFRYLDNNQIPTHKNEFSDSNNRCQILVIS